MKVAGENTDEEVTIADAFPTTERTGLLGYERRVRVQDVLGRSSGGDIDWKSARLVLNEPVLLLYFSAATVATAKTSMKLATILLLPLAVASTGQPQAVTAGPNVSTLFPYEAPKKVLLLRQLSTSFWTVSRAFVSSTPPHMRRVLRSTWYVRGPGADWC